MQVLVLGAGQLARMMALAGAPLNIKVHAFDVRTNQVICPVSHHNSGSDLAQSIANADVITAEFEHIAPDLLQLCQQSNKFFPGARAIEIGGDRRLEKALLAQANVNSAQFQLIENKDDIKRAINQLGLPLVFKSALDGYDGKGQWRLTSLEDVDALWLQLSQFLADSPQTERQAILAEQFIPFARELSIIGVRNARGDVQTYPLTENIHTSGILSTSLALNADPALQAQAEQMFNAVATTLDYVGVLAIEFFDLGAKMPLSERLMVNEIAPRVHNSGHWTQQGAPVCQFENHLRAVCGLPLGCTKIIQPSLMVNIVGEVEVPDQVMQFAHLHWYDKAPRPKRKIGHLNISALDMMGLVSALDKLMAQVSEADFPALSATKARLIELADL